MKELYDNHILDLFLITESNNNISKERLSNVMKNFSKILIEKKSLKNAVFFLFELTYDKCYDLKKDLMFKIFHFPINSLKIYIWAKNNRYNYMKETYYEQFGEHFVIRNYAYNELSRINEAYNFVNILHSSNVYLCLSFVENFVPNNFFAKNLIENQKIIQCLKLELDFINLKFKAELFFITTSKYIKYHNFMEKTYLIEYSAIIVQKLFDFYIEIASFKFYKFFIDKTEIKIVNQKYERLFLENDNMVTLKSPINSNCELIEIILLSNLSLKIRFIENINSKKNKLKTDRTSINHELISPNGVKFHFNIFLSKGLEEKLKRNEISTKTFFSRYHQLCKFDNLFFQNLGLIKNFFSLDLNVKYYNILSFVNINLKNIQIKSFDEFKKNTIDNIFSNNNIHELEIFTFSFCLDAYKNGIDILRSKNYNNIENIDFILDEKFYLDGNSKDEKLSNELNKFRKIYENKTNFFIHIRDFFSKQIKKTIYFLFFENFFSEFENYHKMIQTKDFVKKMCSEKQTAQAEIINKIINIFDIKSLFPILINKTSFDDLLKVFVAFFVLKEYQVSEPMMSESFEFVKKVVKNKIQFLS